MLMTDQAYELVQSGLPFREAYIKVKSQQETSVISKTLSRKNSSSGSAYNLDLKTLKTRLKKLDKSK
jgi:argininosuccinate lyase